MNMANMGEVLNAEIKNLKKSMYHVTQNIEKTKDACQIQASEVNEVIEPIQLSQIETLPLQSLVVRNDNLEMEIRSLKSNLECRLRENTQLKYGNEKLNQQIGYLDGKIKANCQYSRQLFQERGENTSNFDQLHSQINELADKIKQLEEIQSAAVKTGDQMRQNAYEQLCLAESHNQALTQTNVVLRDRLENFKRCDVQQANSVIQEATNVINMLNQKIELLEKEVGNQRQQTNTLQQAMQASAVAKTINNESIAASRLNQSDQLSKIYKSQVREITEHSQVCGSQMRMPNPVQTKNQELINSLIYSVKSVQK